MQTLPDSYISGFVDGEGCFALNSVRDKRRGEYRRWMVEFAIVLHPSDAPILDLVKTTLGVGNISFNSAGTQVRYSVQKIAELQEVIVPFFHRSPLFGRKAKDFELWSEAIALLDSRQRGGRIGKGYATDEVWDERMNNLLTCITRHKRHEDVNP